MPPPDLIFELQRDDPSPTCTIGTLTRIGHAWQCRTLEPAPTADHPSIPAGEYPIVMAWSNRFGRRVPHVLDVPGRTAIEIHAGNDSTDTHGCILLGMRATPTALVDSNAAVHAFCVQLEADPEQHAYLQVLDHQATA